VDLQKRVVNMLTKPGEEWSVVAAEASDASVLYREYAAPLAAIPSVCGFVGMSIVGVSVPLVGSVRVGLARGFTNMVVQYVLSLVALYVAALVIEKLAPTFQSKGTTIQALKLVVYASTPMWIAGVLNLVPALGAITVLAGLYGIYLFYLGLTPLMSTPPEKVVPFMIVSGVVMVVLFFVVGALTTAVARPVF
jgi:hypothetical protein